jgi:hypothetical protein
VSPISFYTGTSCETIFANGFAYPIANASSSAAQSLVAGASGKNQMPLLPGGFFQQGRSNQIVTVDFTVILATSGTPSVLFTAGINTSPTVGGQTLVSTNTFATSTWTNAAVYGRVLISNFGSGYIGSGTITNLWSTMSVTAQNSGASQVGVVAVGGPTNLTASDDFSVNQWLYLTVTFGAPSSSNTATLQQLVVRGEN